MRFAVCGLALQCSRRDLPFQIRAIPFLHLSWMVRSSTSNLRGRRCVLILFFHFSRHISSLWIGKSTVVLLWALVQLRSSILCLSPTWVRFTSSFGYFSYRCDSFLCSLLSMVKFGRNMEIALVYLHAGMPLLMALHHRHLRGTLYHYDSGTSARVSFQNFAWASVFLCLLLCASSVSVQEIQHRMGMREWRSTMVRFRFLR